jgi:cation diffusion facilitator CzcD-associated flavoprotein CzcO
MLTSRSNWKWPDVKGLHSFKGKLMHSAAYEEGYPLDGKRVAVVGAGSSGIQIVATIASSVKKLYSWVRSPTWVTAGFAQRFAGPDGQNFACEF